MLKSKPQALTWQPSAAIERLKERAKIIRMIREFFYARNVVEVETSLLAHTSVPDPFIESIPAIYKPSAHSTRTFYLQTSPEYAMKRLLAAGSGSIFQICKAFRQGELGRLHNPEFTMLEWYRTSFTHHDLMDEMDEFLQLILKCGPATRSTYAELFAPHHINPHTASCEELAHCAQQHHLSVVGNIDDRDTWLNLLMTHVIEPTLGQTAPCFVYDFPASQAALARIEPGPPAVAARFEVYCKGIELANGFYELTNADEQRRRFESNLRQRKVLGLPAMLMDEYLLAALSHGLPDCAGVALGIDRLIMLALGCENIQDVISFDIHRA